MSQFKDLFSGHANDYARYRPTYPVALYRYLAGLAPARERAWDCATGNGQAAVELAKLFREVVATDASDKQLASAQKVANVRYAKATAEVSGLESGSIDLVTVAQAFHWFRQKEFFAEVKRVLRPGGVLAFWCYDLAHISAQVDEVSNHFCFDVLGKYWEPERKLVEEHYRHVDIPFATIGAPEFSMDVEWRLEDWLGYVGTWSALQKARKVLGTDPLAEIRPQFEQAWGPGTRNVRWAIGLRVARV